MFPCLENDKAKILRDIRWHLEKCPRNGANKPDMSVLDKVKKEWFIIEGTVCMPGTIPARTMFKRDKYADLKLGVKSLYPGHNVSRKDVVFDSKLHTPLTKKRKQLRFWKIRKS